MFNVFIQYTRKISYLNFSHWLKLKCRRRYFTLSLRVLITTDRNVANPVWIIPLLQLGYIWCFISIHSAGDYEKKYSHLVGVKKGFCSFNHIQCAPLVRKSAECKRKTTCLLFWQSEIFKFFHVECFFQVSRLTHAKFWAKYSVQNTSSGLKILKDHVHQNLQYFTVDWV